MSHKERTKTSIIASYAHSFARQYSRAISCHQFTFSYSGTLFHSCTITSSDFNTFRLIHDSVSRHSILVDDKRYSKDVQETTNKLVEICNNYVASSLQQTTWLRKNYAVKLTNSGKQNEEATSVSNENNNQNEIDRESQFRLPSLANSI